MTQLLAVLVLALVALALMRMATRSGDDADEDLTPTTPVSVPRPGPALRPHPQAMTAPQSPRPARPVAAPLDRTRRSRLFGIGGPSADGFPHDGPYAVVGYAVTGFTPVRDRLVTVAVVHTDAEGAVEGHYVTHISPGRAALPPHLEPVADQIVQAPTFVQAAPHLLRLLEGRVVVTQHAEVLESFLDAHLMEAGVLAPSLPALSTFETARTTFRTRNHRLSTLAREVESNAVPGRSPLEDAYATASLLPTILRTHRGRLRYPCRAEGDPGSVVLAPAARPDPGPRPDPWLAGVFAGASGLARELNDSRVARFVDVLVPLLLQGRLVVEEVRGLTRLMVAAGYNADQLRGIQERLLESLRKSAFEHKRLSPTQLRHLRATATSVGIPTYFDDLIPPPAPEPGSGSFSRPVRKPLPPSHQPRCGHCLQMGHYTSQCPRRERGPVKAIAPI